MLLDINDSAPIFIPSDVYTARISEASQPGIEVKQVLAIDSDETVGRIQYFLNPSPESQAFEITSANRETGVVTLRQQVNREQSEFVRLIVRAEDRGDPRLTGKTRTRAFPTLGPVFCLLFRVSSGCARPITEQVTSVT